MKPNPFSPDGDRVEDEAMITYTLPAPVSDITVRIFDLFGRQVRVLAAAMVSGPKGTLIWDGRDDSGRPGRTGLYIIYFESYDRDGSDRKSGRRSARTTVVLARREP